MCQCLPPSTSFLGMREPKKVILRDYSSECLEYSKANKAKRSYERDVLTLEGHVLDLWGNQQLAHITPKMIEEYKVRRLQYVVAATVNREIDTIKNMLRKAVEWGYLKSSPGEFVKKLKTGTPHFRYPSGEETKELLEACRHKMRSGFENAVKRSGIPHVRFHDLHHTFASHLVMGGVDIRTVQELLGHKDIRMTMRYSHLAPDHMRKAVSVLDYENQESGTKNQKHCQRHNLDSHYLDTKGSERENQDEAVQA